MIFHTQTKFALQILCLRPKVCRCRRGEVIIMYFVPDGTKICGLHECEICAMRFLSLETSPQMICPYCDEEADMELGPDEVILQEPESAKLVKVVRDEEVEMMDGLLSLAHTGGDFEWL